MAQIISVDIKIVKNILTTLEELKKEVARLNKKLETEPPYGSDEWWKWSNTKALQEVKEGKGTIIHNKKELKEFFNSLRET